MKHFWNVFLLWLASTCISLGISGISYFFLDVNVFFAGLNGFFAFWIAFIPMLVVYIKRFKKANESNLYRKKNIKAAHRKVKQMRMYKYKVHSFDKYRKIDRVYKIAKQIIKVVKDDPKRYGSAKNFFADYLDSTLLIVEKYALFLQQPVKDQEVNQSLIRTEQALEDMSQKLEGELMEILSNDRISLDIELEYVGQALNKETELKSDSLHFQEEGSFKR